jgi:glycine/D-amino acid oxidase-like deaminating enzyme
VIRDTLSARIAPRRALAALAAAVRAAGGSVGATAAGQGAPVVWATGAAGLAAMDAGGPVKGQAAVLGFDAGPAAPQLYALGLHIVPHADGTVAVGSTSETAFADPTATDALLDEVIARARLACPALAAAAVVARWAGLRPRARSRQPLIGPWPGRPGHFVLNGGFKTGFGIAPLAAERLADLVLDGRDAIPPAFRPPAPPRPSAGP